MKDSSVVTRPRPKTCTKYEKLGGRFVALCFATHHQPPPITIKHSGRVTVNTEFSDFFPFLRTYRVRGKSSLVICAARTGAFLVEGSLFFLSESHGE